MSVTRVMSQVFKLFTWFINTAMSGRWAHDSNECGVEHFNRPFIWKGIQKQLVGFHRCVWFALGLQALCLERPARLNGKYTDAIKCRFTKIPPPNAQWNSSNDSCVVLLYRYFTIFSSWGRHDEANRKKRNCKENLILLLFFYFLFNILILIIIIHHHLLLLLRLLPL